MMEGDKWYLTLDYQKTKEIIGEKIVNIRNNFVEIGFLLKQIRDNKAFEKEGYKNIYEFAENLYGITRSTASRWIDIIDRFSEGGNTPILAEEYKEFGKSQLQEMLYLTNEQLKEVRSEMTVREIKEIKKSKKTDIDEIKVCDIAKEEQLPGQMELHDYPGICPDETTETSIDVLDFTVRTYNSLKRAGISTIEQLRILSNEELMQVERFSPKCVEEVHEKLKKYAEECATSHTESVMEIESDMAEDIVQNEEETKRQNIVNDYEKYAEDETAQEEPYEEATEESDLQIAIKELEKAKSSLNEWLEYFSENDIRVRTKKILVAALACYVTDLEEVVNPAPQQSEVSISDSDKKDVEYLKNGWLAMLRQFQKKPTENKKEAMNLIREIIYEINIQIYEEE